MTCLQNTDVLEAIYAQVRAGFEIFWDEGRGAYVDYVKDGVQQRPVNQLAGALAIVSRLAPADRWQRIIETITDANRLVVRSWAHPQKDEDVSEAMRNHMAVMVMGVHIPIRDVENEIVIAEPS